MSDPADLYAAFDSDPAAVVAFLRHVASEWRLPAEPSVLDVGCGPGRLLPPVRALGWRVVGMEPHPGFRARAAATAREHGAEVRPGGFENVDAVDEFDLVVGINSSFAHVLTPGERDDAFRRAARALTPDGVLVLDLPNFLWILRNYRPPEPVRSTVDGREATLTHRHEIDFHQATFTTLQTYAVDGREPVMMEHRYAMTTFPELERGLLAAGFRDVLTFNGFASRSPERLTGARMLIVASRRAG